MSDRAKEYFIIKYLLPGMCLIISCLFLMVALVNYFLKTDPFAAFESIRKENAETAADTSDFYEVGKYTIDTSTGIVYIKDSAGVLAVVTDADGKPLTSDNLTVTAP